MYELIQNAEDAEYTRADRQGSLRYLSFTLRQDNVVIDSNEDGFNEANVRAICSTGESTKTKAEGYIGEKGIGFKSVFKVASKVHIQSGPFSFSFQYTRDSDDDGLSMITPLNEDYEKLPKSVQTRMTLTLLPTSNFEQRFRDLLDIPDTLLLFLNKLEQIQVKIDLGENSTEHVYQHVKSDGRIQELTETTTANSETSKVIKAFHVTKKKVTDLPYDGARKHSSRATVVLAFPLDSNDMPVIEQQYVFAYLPLRKAGFTVSRSLRDLCILLL